MISIIVPVYNSSRFLDNCIGSVVSQTYSDIELLLINDGSTDNSREICDYWANKDYRVRVISQSNAGVSVARNRGLSEARGEFIMFLDSDDAIHEETCFRLLQYQKEKHADCVIFGTLQNSGTLWIPREEKVYNSSIEFQKDFESNLNTELLSPVWNKLYRRVDIKHVFPEEMSFGEDLVFSLRYLKQCETICFVPWPCYLHNNLNELSITHTFRVKQINDIERWQDAILEFNENFPVSLGLYAKYVKDVLIWLKRFYASEQLSYKEKGVLLKQWYPHSHLKSIVFAFRHSSIDRFILICLHWHLWLLPNLLLAVKYAVKRNK